MALRASNWVHGSAAIVQTAAWKVARSGKWTTVRPNSESGSPWIHLAVPTPSVTTTKIQSAMVRLANGPKTSLVEIDVWDGEFHLRNFKNFPNPGKTFPINKDKDGNEYGDFAWFEFKPPVVVQWGVGISMKFKVDAPDQNDSVINVIGAGAEFVTEPK